MVQKKKRGRVMATGLSSEELKSLIPLDAQMLSASALHIQATGNDFLLIFLRTRPVKLKDGALLSVAISEPVAVITVSPQSAKDFSILLARVIAKHEKDFGEIETPFTRRQVKNGGPKSR